MKNVKSTSRDPIETTPKTLFTYSLLIKGAGGEFMIGAIPIEAAKYWHDRDEKDLSCYVNSPEGSDLEPAEEEYRLPHWHELDHFGHENGIEEIQSLIVEDAAGNKILELDSAGLETCGMIRDVDFSGRGDIDNTEDGIIFSRTREKGCCVYTIVTDAPFDPAKLVLNRIDMWDYVMISDVLYDGVRVRFDEGFDRDYADFEAFVSGV